MNISRSCPSGAVLGDYLYVFGGAELETSIERFNIKSSMTKVVEKFETLEIKLPIGASEIGIVPLSSFSELMLVGGFGGQPTDTKRSLNQRLRFVTVADGSQGNSDFMIEDLSQTQCEESTSKSEMKPDFFQACQMIMRDGSKTLIFGA
jgi:hypothetical protein